MNTATRTQYDNQINYLTEDIKYKQEEITFLKEELKILRFKAICEILGVDVGSVVDLVFKNGKTVAFKLVNSDEEGNAEFYMVKPIPNFFGQRTVFLDTLQKGLYNGVDNFKIVVHK